MALLQRELFSPSMYRTHVDIVIPRYIVGESSSPTLNSLSRHNMPVLGISTCTPGMYFSSANMHLCRQEDKCRKCFNDPSMDKIDPVVINLHISLPVTTLAPY